MKKIVIFLVMMFQIGWLDAQIAPPDLRCVRRDTLLWNLPTNSCGAFQAYLIYAARNRNGPYALLARVTVPTQTRYFHADANGENWFYHMESEFNCPGQTRLRSDTIDNRPPALQQPLAVSVASGNLGIEIRWRRSISSQTTGYIIYRETPLGLVAIDTVRSRDSIRYVDSRINPRLQSVGYQILALDDCGNTSLFDSTHYSIFLRTRQSACDQTLTLSWNLYRNWQNPILKHEIWLSENGRNPYLLTSVGARDTSFVFNNLTNRSRYSFFVRAVQAVTNISARSNESLDTANIVEPVKQLFVKNVTVNNQNRPEIVWFWNDNARIDTFYIRRSTGGSPYATAIAKKPVLPIERENIITDSTAGNLATLSPVSYQLRTRDNCGTFFNSTNSAATIHLSGEAGVKGQNVIEWTPFVFPSGVILNYLPYRIANGSVSSIGSPLDTTKPRRLQDIALQGESRVCYYVETRYRVQSPTGITEELTSRSNTICLEQEVTIWMPNAFAPNGKNYDFKPVVLFPENIADYEFAVFNRWGERIFETTDYNEAWRGNHNEKPMPQGLYSFYVKITQKDGKTGFKKGSVMLLR